MPWNHRRTGQYMLLAFACLPALAQSAKSTAGVAQYSPLDQLRNYGLSACLASAYPDTAAGKDASQTAGGYIELGSAPIEVYTHTAEMARQFLKRDYPARSGIQLQTMKCIDFAHSPELNQYLRKALAGRR